MRQAAADEEFFTAGRAGSWAREFCGPGEKSGVMAVLRNASFDGLEFWARKGSDPNEPMERFEVAQNDLNFWQAIARCTAYASFLAIGRGE